MYYDFITVSGENYSLDSIKSEYNEGTKDGTVFYYSVSRYCKHTERKIINGTIRSTHCKEILSDSEINVCMSCAGLTKMQAFVKRVQRSNGSKSGECSKQSTSKSSTTVNNKFLARGKGLSKLKQYRKRCDNQRLTILGLSRTIVRLKTSKMKLSERLGEQAKIGDVSAIIQSLNLAHEKGLLKGKSKILKFVADITKT